jgi:hypothetical protein
LIGHSPFFTAQSSGLNRLTAAILSPSASSISTYNGRPDAAGNFRAIVRVTGLTFIVTNGINFDLGTVGRLQLLQPRVKRKKQRRKS